MEWLRKLFNIKPKYHSVEGRCKCEHSRKTQMLGSWEGAALQAGRHTNFIIYKCFDCKGVVGFPDSNLQLVLDEGTEKSKAEMLKFIKEESQ